MSADEKEEMERLDEMEDAALAEVEIFVSKEQQKALALDVDDISEETRLTKNDKAPPPITEDISEMTGSTRESKAQRYADKAVKEVATQYTATISNMHHDMADKDDKIAELQRQLQLLQNPSFALLNTSEDNDSRNQEYDDNNPDNHLLDIENVEKDSLGNEDITSQDNQEDFPPNREEGISISSSSNESSNDDDLSFHSDDKDKSNQKYHEIRASQKRAGDDSTSSLSRAIRARTNISNNQSMSTSDMEVDEHP